MAIIYLNGVFQTNFEGIKRLHQFFVEASQYRDTELYIDFTRLIFLDGNLCALLHSMLYRLSNNNNLIFATDFEYVNSKFDVLVRNGFIPMTGPGGDMKNSTIGLKQFDVKDVDGFVNYIQNDLLAHRGMKLSQEEYEKIFDCIIEIFTNVDLHSKTIHPFFACGQYFPEKNVLKFTMVDIGNGFLPAIQAKTMGNISNSYDAIRWALEERNTTKIDSPGGLGLPTLLDYFKTSTGNMQIITGNTYWSSEFDKSLVKYQKFVNPCVGTMINLLFSYN